MKYVHNISVRAFCLPEESLEDVEKGLLFLLGYSRQDLADEKISIDIQNAKGFNDRTIRILTVELSRDRNCNHVIGAMRKSLSIQDRELLLFQHDRLDAKLCFFIRFDKKSAQEGRLALTDSGECYHVRFSISAFPKSRDAALKAVQAMLSG